MVESHCVLDLDDTLIHAFFITPQQLEEITTKEEFSYLKERTKILHVVDIGDNDIAGRGDIAIIMIVLRPYMREFLDFILTYFDKVSIWSAGEKRYVRAIESIIFPPDNELYRIKSAKVLTRRDCNEITKVSVLKDLASKGFDLTKTLLIDDNTTTSANNRDNAIHLPAYDLKLLKEHITYDDNTLLHIIEWLKANNVNQCPDVRKLNKKGIFPKRESVSRPSSPTMVQEISV